MPTDQEFTKILIWPRYCVYRHEIDEKAKKLRLWIRRKGGNRRVECSGCGRKFREIYDVSERAVRDLSWGEFQTTVFVEVYRSLIHVLLIKTSFRGLEFRGHF